MSSKEWKRKNYNRNIKVPESTVALLRKGTKASNIAAANKPGASREFREAVRRFYGKNTVKGKDPVKSTSTASKPMAKKPMKKPAVNRHLSYAYPTKKKSTAGDKVRGFVKNELLGVDDFSRAVKYGKKRQFAKAAKSAASGAVELGGTALAALASVPTGGGAMAGRVGLKVAAKEGAKQVAKQTAKKTAKNTAKKVAKTTATKRPVRATKVAAPKKTVTPKPKPAAKPKKTSTPKPKPVAKKAPEKVVEPPVAKKSVAPKPKKESKAKPLNVKKQTMGEIAQTVAKKTAASSAPARAVTPREKTALSIIREMYPDLPSTSMPHKQVETVFRRLVKDGKLSREQRQAFVEGLKTENRRITAKHMSGKSTPPSGA